MKETTYHIPRTDPQRTPGMPCTVDQHDALRRIAVLGDFHNGRYEPILSSLDKRRPTLITIPGDLVYAHAPEHGLIVEEQKNVLPLLRGCVAIAPTFMSLGNHESILCEEDVQLIKETGVIILDNEWHLHNSIWLGGLTSHYVLDWRAFRKTHPSKDHYPRHQHDDKWEPIEEPDTTWIAPVPQGFSLLLSHQPEYYPLLPTGIGLIISAHAHGGQWRICGRGLFAPGQGWFPKYTSGVYGNMVITRGLTNTAKVPRINNPTEIVYIEAE